MLQLRACVALVLAATVTGWPHFWTDPSSAEEGGPMPEKVPGCLEHPTKAYGTHGTVYNDPRVTYRLLLSGKPTARPCAGGTYAIELSFAGGDKRFALLTASQGTLQKSYQDACPGRVSLDRHMARGMGLTSLFNTFSVNLTLPCNSSGPLEIRSTSSNMPEDTLNQASVSFIIDSTCPPPSCAKAPAPSPPPPPPPPPPVLVSAYPEELCSVPKQPTPKCSSSPLGYSCGAQLHTLGLHWTVGGCPPQNPCTAAYVQRNGGIASGQQMLHFALQANTTGYLAVAFARSTHSMVNSDAVLGWVAGGAEEDDMVEAFKISRLSLSFSDAYSDATQWLLYSGIVRQDRQTTLCFTRPLSAPSAAHSPSLSAALPLNMLYALGPDNSRSFAMHRAWGGFTLDMVTGGVDTPPRDWTGEIHGILMVLAWGLLAPLGVVAARRKGALQGRKVGGVDAWFQVHRAAQLGAVVLFACSLVLGFVKLGGGRGGGLKAAHKALGIALAVAVGVQVVLGFVRPATAHRARQAWRHAHMLLGCASVLLALANVGIGLQLYTRKSGRSVVPFAVPVGVVLGAWVGADLWLMARARWWVGRSGGGRDGCAGGGAGKEEAVVKVSEMTAHAGDDTDFGSGKMVDVP